MNTGSLPGNHTEAQSLILSSFLKRIILRLEQSCSLHSAFSFLGTYQSLVRMSSVVSIRLDLGRCEHSETAFIPLFLPAVLSHSVRSDHPFQAGMINPVGARAWKRQWTHCLSFIASFITLYQFGTRKSRVCSNYEEMPCCDFPFGFLRFG